MAVDTVAPRTRRAILLGAVGGALASVAAFVKPAATRAGVDGDVVLDAANTAAGTTAITGASSNPVLQVVGGTMGTVSAGSSVGVRGSSGVALGSVPAPIAETTGVYGISAAGHGVYGASDTGVGVYAANNSSTVAAIVAEGDPGTAIHGHANAGPVPASPALTGVYGSATDTGVAIAADAASGLALRATSSAGNGIRGRGQLDGVIGESPGGRSGVVGYSGSGAAPGGPAKTGVYGEATQDTASRGVSGFSISGQGVRGDAASGIGVAGFATTGQGVRGQATSGQGVRGEAATGVGVFGQVLGAAEGRAVLGKSDIGTGVRGEATTGQAVRGDAQGGIGVFGQSLGTGGRGVIGKADAGVGVRAEATTGVGVQAVATTGVALAVTGRTTFSRSGRANVAANQAWVDVTIPGGLPAGANVLATLQMYRAGVWVAGARLNYPTAGQVRIYLNKVASSTGATPLAWFVLG